MLDRDGVEHLTPEEHIEKADKALFAAQELRREMDNREVEEGRARGKISEWYLSREHDFLTLMQIVNVHANMATAKSLITLKSRNAPIEFAVPVGDVRMQVVNSKGDVIFDTDQLPGNRAHAMELIDQGICPEHGDKLLENGMCPRAITPERSP
jgi:hypothetical protein